MRVDEISSERIYKRKISSETMDHANIYKLQQKDGNEETGKEWPVRQKSN